MSLRPRADIWVMALPAGPKVVLILCFVPGHVVSMPAAMSGVPPTLATMRVIAAAQLEPMRIPMARAQCERADERKEAAEKRL
mmetsp:Transcript_21697/g.58051  ORF Transcript_21697/g.58051 Transcript_21697/m.58051 type:complete len:83 (+) Transcript_21697:192-440(+)